MKVIATYKTTHQYYQKLGAASQKSEIHVPRWINWLIWDSQAISQTFFKFL